MRPRKALTLAGLAFLASVIVIQLLPVDRRPPDGDGLIPAPEHVMRVLRESCFDCHSNRTRWPWYGYVAPFSWVIEDHLEEARAALDLTAWNQYDEDERLDLQEEIWDEVDLEKMPPAYYVFLHPEGSLSEADKRVLRAWSTQADR